MANAHGRERHSNAGAAHSAKRALRFTALVVMTACSGDCDESKGSVFFDPTVSRAPTLLDVDAPKISYLSPREGLTGNFNIQSLQTTVVDVDGVNGAKKSGVANVSVTIDNQVLPTTRSGDVFTTLLTSVTPGQKTAIIVAEDSAKNKTQRNWTFNLVNAPPMLAVTAVPSATQPTSNYVETVTVTATVVNTALATATTRIARRGNDNTCNSAGAVLWTEGFNAGQVYKATSDNTSAALATGSFTSAFITFNGQSVGGSGGTADYCVVVNATTNTIDGDGKASPLTATSITDVPIAWRGPTNSAIAIFTLNNHVPQPNIGLGLTGGLRVTTGADGLALIANVAPGNWFAQTLTNSGLCVGVQKGGPVAAGNTLQITFDSPTC